MSATLHHRSTSGILSNYTMMYVTQSDKVMCGSQVVRDGYAASITWKQLEMASKQYSEKLKRTDNLPDLVSDDSKVTYDVKMMSKDNTVHSIYR